MTANAPSAQLSAAERYTGPAIVLHWIIAILMIINVALVLSVDALPEDWTRPMIDAHKSFGITVLGLAIMRLLWRFGHRPPPLPATYANWEKIASHLGHLGLYVLIFALPLSGWMHDSAWKDADSHPLRLFNLIPWPRFGFITSMAADAKEQFHSLAGEVHETLGTILYILLAAHILGALKHQFMDKEPELQRMMLGSKNTD
jgi:cytochrome b561